MPSSSFPHLLRFLHGVHRRLRLLRLAECAAVGVAITSGLSLPLMALLAWRHDSATAPVITCIALGLVGGAAWGLTQVPSLFESAIEADRQLDWADLLGTALTLGAGTVDPWHRAVLIEADRRCSEVSPSALLLRRLGPRAWSGMALLLTLVLTLCAWIGSPAPSLANDAKLIADSTRIPPDAQSQPLLTPVAISRGRPSAAPPDGQDAVPANQTSNKPENASDATSPRTPGSDSGKEATSPDGHGGSLGRSQNAPSKTMPSADSVTPGRVPTANGNAAGGNAAAADSSLTGQAKSSGRVGQESAGQSAKDPWASNQWPSAAETAGQAISAGEVPPSDREMVRDYFRRE